MSIREQENILFAKWAQKYEGLFVSDGAPCSEQFEKEKIKITFVLKEAVSPGESWDMRSWVDKHGGRSQAWDNITRWTQAILKGGDYLRTVSREDRVCWLRRISFLNLKKVGGGNTTINSELVDYAKNDAHFIWEQLCIYNPDVIVACGSYVEWLLWEHILLPRQKTDEYVGGKLFGRSYKTQFSGKDSNTNVICFRHPSRTFGKDKELYDQMVEIVHGFCL